MTKQEINLKWNDKMSFTTEIQGHEITIDADESVGGEDKGVRPKPLMMLALAGCTSMDVISILRKMRVELDYFNVNVQAEMTEEHPKHYTKFHLVYQFKGEDLPLDKLEKAVSLSQERYCGVSYFYAKVADVSYEIEIL